jgi:TRAP-type transport system small permease protein
MELTKSGSRAGDFLKWFIERPIRKAYYMAMAILGIMMFLTVVDVVGRYFFNRPVTGSYELIQFMMAILVSFGISYTAVEKGHVGVDLLTVKLTAKTRAIIACVTNLVGLALFALITWQGLLQARTLWSSGATSASLLIPVYPFIYLFCLGTLMFCLVIVKDFVESVTEVLQKWNRS